jgi:hypothetical protein
MTMGDGPDGVVGFQSEMGKNDRQLVLLGMNHPGLPLQCVILISVFIT